MKPAASSEALAWRSEGKGFYPLPGGYVSLLEAAGELVGVHERIGAVNQQHIEVIGAQLAQRVIHTGDHMRG